jgi:hypothetical protein
MQTNLHCEVKGTKERREVYTREIKISDNPDRYLTKEEAEYLELELEYEP